MKQKSLQKNLLRFYSYSKYLDKVQIILSRSVPTARRQPKQNQSGHDISLRNNNFKIIINKNLKSEGFLIPLNKKIILNVKKLVAYLRHAELHPIQLLQTFLSSELRIKPETSYLKHLTDNF